MKNKTKVIISLAFIIVSVISCSKNEPNPVEPGEKEIIIPKTTKPLTVDEINNNLVSITDDSTTFTFKNTLNNKYKFKKDDIIIIPNREGLLRKVTSVQKNNNKVVLKTTQGTIAEAIEKGKLSYKSTLSQKQIKKISYFGKGTILENSSLGKTNDTNFVFAIDKILYDVDGNNNTENDQIKLVGNFTMTTDIVFEIEVSWFKLQNVKYGFETNVTDNLSLLASIDYTLEKEISLAHIIFTPIYLQIGPVPVIITPEMDVKVGINGFAYASFSTSIEYSSKFEAGIIYKKDEGWGTYNNFKKSFDFSPPQLSAGVGAKAFIKPEIGMFVYNVLGAYTSATLYSQIKANINETPWWSLYLGMDVGVGAKAKIHSVDLFDFEKDDVITYKYLLAEATGRPNTKPTADFSVIPSYGTTETNFSFDASKCSDNEDPVSALQTRWDWENDGNWDTGYSNNKQIYHRFNNEGTYSVKLEVKDSEGLTDEIIKNVVVTNSTQKLITIISPNGGENWVVGTSHEIQWSDNFDENVRIELWKDNSKITSISNNTESDGSFIWNIPSNFDNYSGYKVKIINSGDESIYDESDNSFTIATSTINEGGLIAYYPFNGNANDESGNGNNGTVEGATLTTDRFGHQNSAYKFDGVNDFMKLSDIKTSETNMTFNFWAKLDTSIAGNEYYGVFYKGDSSSYNYDYYIGFSHPIGCLHTRSKENINNYGHINTEKEWHMYTVKYYLENDSIKTTLYQDGLLLEPLNNYTALSRTTIPNEYNNYFIGRRWNYYGDKGFYYGSLDDIRVYNKILSEREINSLYHEGGW